MNDRMRAAMLEATRLTGAGRLLEATATIQRTLQGMLTPDATAGTTAPTTEAPIEGSFCVIDTVALPTEPPARGPERRPCDAVLPALPPPPRAEDRPHGREHPATELTDAEPFPRAAASAEAPALGQSPLPQRTNRAYIARAEATDRLPCPTAPASARARSANRSAQPPPRPSTPRGAGRRTVSRGVLHQPGGNS